ncbi:multicopper oxidase family protein [Streptomyces sp. 1222.5]|uniref:multicopper oxidase family protein n=1 Tax=Streptomyces sp. 1222.5 TaxID=1881026 RepID=UPI003EBB7CA1
MTSINRRSALLAGLSVAGAGLLAACSSEAPNSPSLISASGSEAVRTEKRRSGTGRVHRVNLAAAPGMLDLGGGTIVPSWAFNGEVPGKEVRISAGDTLAAELSNRLPGNATTSIHWHGIALRSDMDGVPQVTQAGVRAGASFRYQFIADVPGTYFFHPHVGVQLDRGLYAPLIVEDPREPLAYDDEWVVVLDDWLDGVTGTPDEAFEELKGRMGGSSNASASSDSASPAGRGMGGTSGMGMGAEGNGPTTASPSASVSSRDAMPSKFMLSDATSELLGGDAGDVKYPYHLINGRVPAAPAVYTGKPGQRVRLRIINAGGDTAYRVALGGHKFTVTHTDGFPVEHQQTDALLIGMGERYDVLVTLDHGVFPFVALAEGKRASGMALVRTGLGRAPKPTVRPAELDGMIMTAAQLRSGGSVRLPEKKPDRVHRVELTGNMNKYTWSINGRQYDADDPTADPLLIEEGQRVRLDFVNSTGMWHPMHLHGHTYQLGGSGPRKDTTIVLPKKTVSVIFDADNPGQWLLHCHNIYHAEAGMTALVAYAT